MKNFIKVEFKRKLVADGSRLDNKEKYLWKRIVVESETMTKEMFEKMLDELVDFFEPFVLQKRGIGKDGFTEQDYKDMIHGYIMKYFGWERTQ